MLCPKQTKYQKYHKRKPKKNLLYKNDLLLGTIGLQAMEAGWITARQLEATRRTIIRNIKKEGKLYIKIFPDLPITKKAAESRMGSGKGTLNYWVAVIKNGTILFELKDISIENAKKGLQLAASKLPLKTKIIVKIE